MWLFGPLQVPSWERLRIIIVCCRAKVTEIQLQYTIVPFHVDNINLIDIAAFYLLTSENINFRTAIECINLSLEVWFGKHLEEVCQQSSQSCVVRCLRGWVCGPEEPWKINFSVSVYGDRHATCYYFSFNKHASNCWHKLSFRQFVSACHRCNYTIVEGSNLRTHTTSLTKILKIVREKWPSRWNATQSDQIMCHTGAGWTF